MKQHIFLFVLASVLCLNTYAQKKDEIHYSDPFQIDSSEYFLIPRLLDDENKNSYGKGKGFLPWSSYNDIYFYNTTTNQTRKLFDTILALVLPFNANLYYKEPVNELPVNILEKHIVYMARTENFNGDNALDSEDPVYLYISTKTGENLKQITPKGMNVLSWKASKDKKVLLIKLQQDTNKNKKFGEGDDEVYYRVDMNNDISRIKSYQIAL